MTSLDIRSIIYQLNSTRAVYDAELHDLIDKFYQEQTNDLQILMNQAPNLTLTDLVDIR